jgi:hypothetical protein
MKLLRPLLALFFVGASFGPAAPTRLAAAAVPDRPLSQSPLVINGAVAQRNGRPVDWLKLSQYGVNVFSPAIAVAASGVIHVAFGEQHSITSAYAIYHRSSSDGGKTWTEAKNLSEDMPNINVGQCLAAVDGRDRLYVIWRCGLALYYGASPDPGGASVGNLVYRVLENGQWSQILPVNPPATAQTQNQGALAFFAAADAAGRLQVVWITAPDNLHPELRRYNMHYWGIGNGLVLQMTLDGTAPSAPREVFLTPVSDVKPVNGLGPFSDGLDAPNGYFDAAGLPHLIAAVSRTRDRSLAVLSRYQLIENGQFGAATCPCSPSMRGGTARSCSSTRPENSICWPSIRPENAPACATTGSARTRSPR